MRILAVVVIVCGMFVNVNAARAESPWIGVHFMVYTDKMLDQLAEQLPALSKRGVTHLILEVNYHFAYQSHPELAPSNGITVVGAKKFADTARAHHIEIIPQINCLGHQSWKQNTAALLKHYPQFDETPGAYPDNKDIYCRSWCPQHPDVNRVVFALIDELIDAFEAKAFHVGMDEVFLIASEHCERCRGGDPAALFAKAVNDLHGHIVGERGVQMLMWGDRLLDAEQTGYGKWEASGNGTAPAIDRIPKDIILCDWHYEKRDRYPSLAIFLDKGFRVWPAGWKKPEAAEAFAAAAKGCQNPRMLGYLCTTWGAVEIQNLADWPALVRPIEKITSP